MKVIVLKVLCVRSGLGLFCWVDVDECIEVFVVVEFDGFFDECEECVVVVVFDVLVGLEFGVVLVDDDCVVEYVLVVEVFDVEVFGVGVFVVLVGVLIFFMSYFVVFLVLVGDCVDVDLV